MDVGIGKILVGAIILNLLFIFILWSFSQKECSVVLPTPENEPNLEFLNQLKDVKLLLEQKQSQDQIFQSKLFSLIEGTQNDVPNDDQQKILEKIKNERDEFRKLYANSWCITHDTFPNGGFCMKKGYGKGSDVGGNSLWCNVTADKLAQLFQGYTGSSSILLQSQLFQSETLEPVKDTTQSIFENEEFKLLPTMELSTWNGPLMD